MHRNAFETTLQTSFNVLVLVELEQFGFLQVRFVTNREFKHYRIFDSSHIKMSGQMLDWNATSIKPNSVEGRSSRR